MIRTAGTSPSDSGPIAGAAALPLVTAAALLSATSRPPATVAEVEVDRRRQERDVEAIAIDSGDEVDSRDGRAVEFSPETEASQNPAVST